MTVSNNRLKEFSVCNEFEIGVNITDDEISKMAEELLDLRKENKTLQQTTDAQHETTISDLKLIGKLQQENKYLIEDADRLARLLNLSGMEIELPKLEDGEEYNFITALKQHNILMEEHNGTT